MAIPSFQAHLPYDLIARVMELCCDANQYDVLFRCSQVNWEFNRAASRMLYWRVELDLPFTGGAVLDLKRDVDAIPKSSNFESACLPRNAAYVTELKISGYISTRPPPRNTLPQKIANALLSFVNLTQIELTPEMYHESMFDEIVPMLSSFQQLTEIVVNASCTDDLHAPELVKIDAGLRKMTLVSPGRMMLQLLPDWLEKLSGTLVELHLKNNCGSVTPGVLKSFLPFVKDTLGGFTLGLSYSLTNQDVFDFLTQLTKLRRLELQYYWQMKAPERLPRLTSLRSFSVLYPATYTRLEVDRIDKWVRWVITHSPNLEALHLLCESGSTHTTADADTHWKRKRGRQREPAYVSHDALVDHVVWKHWMKLRVLDFGRAFVSVDKLVLMLETCTSLEDVNLLVSRSALTMLVKRPSTLSFLHSISLHIASSPKRFSVDEPQALKVFRNYQPSLYRFSVDRMKWETRWKVDVDVEGDKQSELVAQKVVDAVPPWARKATTSSGSPAGSANPVAPLHHIRTV